MGLFFTKKPFHKLKTKEEFINWFSKSKYWGSLDFKIINAIIDRFIDDLPAFDIFVYISENCDLVKNNFLPLSKDKHIDISYVFSLFSTTLYNVGSKYRDELIKENESDSASVKGKARLLEFSQYAYESAIKLDKYQIPTYFSLGTIWGGILYKYDEGIKYCKKGINKIKELKAEPSNKLNYIQKAYLQDISEIEEAGKLLIRQFEGEIKI